MKRQSVIIYKSEVPECYGNLKLFCETKGISYNTYNRKKMPFLYEGFEVHRVPFQSGSAANAGGKNKTGITTDYS